MVKTVVVILPDIKVKFGLGDLKFKNSKNGVEMVNFGHFLLQLNTFQ